ncbi:copper resistance protein CopC [Glaciihabitans arcticus]|uniref:Copper resistance protein CopC n=1 Tax=Glaciihabitans arcticus TaxID=2668039 RepID=A0A4Q9GR03_9MICO|nr:copper resistance CopC family protein [Glaciihabitans arcticus]TBN57081.1 copper resistance protein CopC [Glaciihabitans arcticus]
MSTVSRLAALATVGALVAVLPVLGLAAPAQAHNSLVSSTPQDGETLTELPEEFSVTTSDQLLDLVGDGTAFGLQILDDAGRYYGDGCLTISDATLSMPAAIGEPGDYTFIWQVVSADGHPVSDEFDFTWAPSGDVTASEGSSAPPVCGEDSAGDSGTRTPTAAPEQQGEAGVDTSSLFWIGGTVLAVLVAVGVTLLLIRPRKK